MLQRRRAEQLLTDAIGLDITHACATLPQLMAWLRRSDRALWPHLIVLGLASDRGADEVLRAVRALRGAGMRVIVLSALSPRRLSKELIDDGVEGFVSTADSEQEFLEAVEKVLAGGTTMTPRVQGTVHAPPGKQPLSDQEHRVFVLYASGLAIADVAEAIGVRPDTARKYLNRVRAKYTKAGRPARTKLDLARIAWSEGYGDPPVLV